MISALKNERPHAWLDSSIIATGGFSVALGVIVIAGWFTRNMTLVKVLPSFEAMRFNTALGFFLAGIGLLSIYFRKPRFFKACGIVIGSLGALTLTEYIFGIDIGIDQLFVKDTISATYPGRLAVPTALGFTFTGGAFLLMGSRAWVSKQHIFLGTPGTIVISIGVIGLIGYFTGHTDINTWGDFISMAFHTAVGFLVLGGGLVASAWKCCAAEEKFLFQWLPVIIGISVLSGTFLLWRVSVTLERANIEKMLHLKTSALRANINDQLESRVQALIRMANRWETHGRPDRKEWQADAELYVSHYGVYRSIMWMDPTLHARWIAPLKGNEADMNRYSGLDLGGSKALEAAREKHKAWMSPAVAEKGGEVFAAFIPIFIPIVNEKFDGFIVGVFGVRELFDSILHDEDLDGYSIALSNNGRAIYSRGEAPEMNGLAHEALINLHGMDLAVRVWPKKELLAGSRTLMPGFILISGILVSGLLALVGYFAGKAQRRAGTAETVNRKLEFEINERERIEQELQRNYEVIERSAGELKRSNAELEQFASVVSHDLQEPLRVIRGYLQLISRRYKGKLDNSADEFIGFAVDGAARMQDIISDLLAYSRVGSRSKSLTSVNCGEIMSMTGRNLGRLIEESGAVITHSPLPTVTADASQLEHLFMNLVGNAIKYRGEEKPSIHVFAEERSDEWLFSFRDNGIGIDPRYSEKIFEMFQRLHGKGSEYSGTGIGLAICKKVVENHNGRIWVESQPGAGSTFFFTLPTQTGKDQAL